MHTPTVKLALGAAVIAVATAANAASDYLLQLDGIKGESKATASIETFQWPRALAGGVFNPFQPALAGGVSVATGDITGDLASDTRWDALELTARSPQGEPYYTYKLKDVLVSSWQNSAANDEHKEWIIIESMSSPIMRWKPPLATGGRGDWIEASWDPATGRLLGDPGVLTAFDDLGALRWADGTLSITAAVPEPGSWALMLLGAAALGARVRQQRVPTQAAAL
jgi:hypothetical protein